MAEKQAGKKSAAGKPNQSEGEYFPVVTRGRRGVEDMLTIMHDEFLQLAAPNVRKGFDTWKARAMMDIISRDELLPILQTRKGLFSIAKGLSRCAVMGIQFGGHFPQAYFMPEGETAALDITWEGYAFIAAHGPGAVLKKAPELVRVYEQDTFGINQAKGEVTAHNFDPRKERGKLAGWYMKLEYLDGTVEVPFITVEKVEQINNNYSKKLTNAGKEMPAWKKSPEEMKDKTAAKQLLKKPAKLSEGLAMALTADDDGPPLEEPAAPPPRDVTDRVGSRLSAAAAGLDPKNAEQPSAGPSKTEEKPHTAAQAESGKEPQKIKAEKPVEKELF